MDQHIGVDPNDAEKIDGILAPLAMQELEFQGTVGNCLQPLGFLVDPKAGLIGMKGPTCQKVFLGCGFPRFKRIIKPPDVAKTGGLGQLDAQGNRMNKPLTILYFLNRGVRAHLFFRRFRMSCTIAVGNWLTPVPPHRSPHAR